uniref:zinc-ribbon domain-containing protein n=1 Tax=Priestia endophytica TaxID=135735 RepID=UPI003850D1EA
MVHVGNLTPNEVTRSSNRCVWWKCQKGMNGKLQFITVPEAKEGIVLIVPIEEYVLITVLLHYVLK